MSSPDEKELKAGHLPAVKVGGVRITRQSRNSGGDKQVEMTAEDEEEFGADGTPKGEKHTQNVVVSGATTKKGGNNNVEKAAFPEEAVKNYHEKSVPANQKRPVQTTHHINQPR